LKLGSGLFNLSFVEERKSISIFLTFGENKSKLKIYKILNQLQNSLENLD